MTYSFRADTKNLTKFPPGIILFAVIGFQILARTETAGGPTGPPLIMQLETLMLKPYLDINQQIQNLTQNKGLTVSDTAFARQKLTNIGYFSLIGGYKTPFINPMTRMYNTGTDFADIYALYLFDKSLRRLTFAYLNDIEIKLGQVISDIFCSKYGEQQSAYLSAANYTPDRRNPNALPKLISILDHFANRDTEHTYIVHQRRRYNNVPLWVVKQALTFGQLSKMYARLKFQQQSAVCRQYENVTERDLGRYLNNLTFFRNVCFFSDGKIRSSSFCVYSMISGLYWRSEP